MQLCGKNNGIIAFTGMELVYSDILIKDIELYDNYTLILLENNLVLKSGNKGMQKLHVPCNCKVVSVYGSSQGIYALSELGVLYNTSLMDLQNNTHFKMEIIAENIKNAFSGYFCSAIDTNLNLWIFDPRPRLCKEVSCVKSACVTQYYSLTLLGIERNAYERYRYLPSLFEIAEEKALEMVVRII